MAAAPKNEKVQLNLDTLERQRTYEEFAVVVGGRRIVMVDARELDWQDLLEIQHPIQFFKHCLTEEDRKFLAAQRLPGWKLNELIQAYNDHFDIDTPGNGAGLRM